jgi:hypothetical protein
MGRAFLVLAVVLAGCGSGGSPDGGTPCAAPDADTVNEPRARFVFRRPGSSLDDGEFLERVVPCTRAEAGDALTCRLGSSVAATLTPAGGAFAPGATLQLGTGFALTGLELIGRPFADGHAGPLRLVTSTAADGGLDLVASGAFCGPDVSATFVGVRFRLAP